MGETDMECKCGFAHFDPGQSHHNWNQTLSGSVARQVKAT